MIIKTQRHGMSIGITRYFVPYYNLNEAGLRVIQIGWLILEIW